MGKLTLCNVKVVAYYLLAHFWFTTLNFTVLIPSHCPHELYFQQQAPVFIKKKPLKSTICYLHSNKRELVNIM